MNKGNVIAAEEAKYVYDQAPRIIPFNLVILSIIILFLSPYLPFNHMVGAWSVFALICLGRYLHAKWVIKQNNWLEKAETYNKQFIIGSGIMGIAWAMVFLSFVNDIELINEFFIVVSLGGITAGALVSMSSLKPAFYAYMLPVLLTPILWYLAQWNIESASISVVVFFFIITLVISYHRSHEIFHKSIMLQIDKDELITDLSEANEKLVKANDYIKSISNTDELTQVPNRRYFTEISEKEWQRAMRTNLPMSMIIIDIDYFKQYNDNYGHLKGDQCLKAVADSMNQIVKRTGDLLARYGGEEFIVMLPETNIQGVQKIAQQLLTTIEKLQIKHETSQVKPYLTISLGIASTIPSDNKAGNIESLIKQADAALYQAKSAGRNQIGIIATVTSS